jgi:hypothetical protein
VRTKARQRRIGGRREAGRSDDEETELRGDLFEAGGMIDGGADNGEIKPIGRADVAIVNLAEMECETVADLSATRRHAIDVACGQRSAERRWTASITLPSACGASTR